MASKRNKPGSRTRGSRKKQQRLNNLIVEIDDKIKADEMGVKNADELELRPATKTPKNKKIKPPTVRIDTLRKSLMNEMASIVIHGRHASERFVQIAPDINLTWEDKIYPGGVWSVDVGTLDVLKDNPEAQTWFKRTFKGKKPSSLRVAKMYVEHLMDDVLPEGANYHFKGQAIQAQNRPGTAFGEGATGADKNKVYQKWWSKKKGMQVLPDGTLLYQADALGVKVTRPPESGAPDEYKEALSKEDWRKRKMLSPNERISNQYGEQWGVPKENWWKVEVAENGDLANVRLKTKNLAYDNFKSGIRRAKIKGKTLAMSPWEWDAVYEAYKYAQKHGYHVDHIDPISKTGFHVWDNLQVLDAQDNLVKSAKTDIEGIIPKRGTYLTSGPLTEKDWVKYTKKNRGLISRNDLLQNAGELLAKEEGVPTIAIAQGAGVNPNRYLSKYDPSIPAEVDFNKFAEDWVNEPRHSMLRQAVEVNGGIRRRGLTKALKRAGALLPVVGAGLDAWDVKDRYEEMLSNPNTGFADWLDKTQFYIASATLGTSFLAEPANFALGMLNLGTDVMRTIFEKEKRDDFGDLMDSLRRGAGGSTKLFNYYSAHF